MYMCTKNQSKGKKEKSIQRRETREQVQYYLGGLPKHLAQLPYPYPDGSYIITYNLPPTSNHTPSLNLTSLSLTLSPAEGKRPTIISDFHKPTTRATHDEGKEQHTNKERCRQRQGRCGYARVCHSLPFAGRKEVKSRCWSEH